MSGGEDTDRDAYEVWPSTQTLGTKDNPRLVNTVSLLVIWRILKNVFVIHSMYNFLCMYTLWNE